MTRLNWWQENFPQGQQTLEILDAGDRLVKLAYGEVGHGSPLLLLHGVGSWSYNWRCNLAALSQQHRVICLDAKGYGFSETPPPPEQAGHQVVELQRSIEALSDRPVAIAAESLGALTALALAQAHPELVDRLILINVPVFPQQLPSVGMQLLAALPIDWVRWLDQTHLLKLAAPVVRAITWQIRREVVADPEQISTADIDWLTYPYLEIPGTLSQFAIDLQLAAQEIDRLQQGQPNLISQIQQRLPATHCPTLILWSDRDRWFPIQNGEALRDRLPHATLKIIENCGHVAASGNPTAVNQAILEFLGS